MTDIEKELEKWYGKTVDIVDLAIALGFEDKQDMLRAMILTYHLDRSPLFEIIGGWHAKDIADYIRPFGIKMYSKETVAEGYKPIDWFPVHKIREIEANPPTPEFRDRLFFTKLTDGELE